jgi:non-ribosomal peptide synthetase component F
MSSVFLSGMCLPPEQEAIRRKCFHPTGTFEEFRKEEVERSVPERFYQIVAKSPDRLAIKGKNHSLTYKELLRSSQFRDYTVAA